MTTTIRACVAVERCGRTCMSRATSTWQTLECERMPVPEYPRRDIVAQEAYKVLVIEQSSSCPSWDELTESGRERWRESADAWAYVIASDAREQMRARQAAEHGRTVREAAEAATEARLSARTGQWSPTIAPDERPATFAERLRRGETIRFDHTLREQREGRLRRMAPSAHYAIHADGTVTKHWTKPPAPPAELEQGPARDTRAETLHIVGPYVGRSASYPRAVNGIPLHESECACPDPTPLPRYNPDHPAYEPHLTVPVDAWLRCWDCHGLYHR